MDRELPARIWVPILAACALVPTAFFIPELARLGALGFGGYFAVGAMRTGQRWLAASYVLVALFVCGVITDATEQALTPQKLAAQEQATREGAQKESAPIDCPALRAAILDEEARIAYVKSAMAGDDTLAADVRLSTKLQEAEYSKTAALAEYTRRCQSQ